jgi:ABC-type transport system involved in multi-copper enzyme maturation permease subunit
MNPVFYKDLLALLRLRRIAALQLFFVAVLAALILLNWPQSGMLSYNRSQDNLLIGLFAGQLILMVLFVPGVAAVSLTSEREANTLEMLYASRLSATQIILGKTLSALSFPFMLVLSGIPFVALLSLRGDVDASQLLGAYAILATAAVLLAVLCLTISAYSKQTSNALVLAYVITLVACGGVLVPASIMLESQSGIVASVLHYIRGFSPVAALLSTLSPDIGGGDFAGTEHGNFPLHMVFLPIAWATIAVCIYLLIVRLRRPPVEADSFSGTELAQQTFGRRVMYLIDPKKQRKPLGRLNPVMGKEARVSGIRSGRWMIRTVYAMVGLSFGLATMSLYGGAEHSDLLHRVFQVLVAFQLGAIALVSPSLTSSTISGEIEGGTFEMLRLSRLRPGQIFWGKFLPAFIPAVLPVLAMAPAYGALCFISPGYISYMQYLGPVVVLAVALCCTIGLFTSSFTANTARASVTAYVITATIFLAPFLTWWAASARMVNERWLPALWSTTIASPLVMALNVLPDATDAVRERYEQHLILIAALCVALMIAARIRLGFLMRRG